MRDLPDLTEEIRASRSGGSAGGSSQAANLMTMIDSFGLDGTVPAAGQAQRSAGDVVTPEVISSQSTRTKSRSGQSGSRSDGREVAGTTEAAADLPQGKGHKRKRDREAVGGSSAADPAADPADPEGTSRRRKKKKKRAEPVVGSRSADGGQSTGVSPVVPSSDVPPQEAPPHTEAAEDAGREPVHAEGFVPQDDQGCSEDLDPSILERAENLYFGEEYLDVIRARREV